MTKIPLATTISSLLVGTMIITPVIGLAAGGYRGGVESTAEREEMRRGNYEQRGREAIAAGDAAMKEKDYEKATAYYKNACDLVPNAPKSQSLYNTALKGFCDASCRLAEQRITEGRYPEAENTLHIVLDERYDPRCKKAIVILPVSNSPTITTRPSGRSSGRM